jgi:hypothetical protein
MVYFFAPSMFLSLFWRWINPYPYENQIQSIENSLVRTLPNPIQTLPCLMKTMLTTCPETSLNFSGLHQFMDCLVDTFLPKATNNQSYFINEIPDQLHLNTDRQMLAAVLNGLLSSVVSYAKDSCIRLSAKIYGNVVLVQVKESASLNGHAFESEVRRLQPLAEKMRGAVCVTSQRKNLTTITFGFPNLPL